jgi:hypothetical protein
VSVSLLESAVGATTDDACARQQGFYLRRDKLDISVYNNSIDASSAEGAAISYTGDRENDTDTAEIHARLGLRQEPMFARRRASDWEALYLRIRLRCYVSRGRHADRRRDR